jgi:hypothetical protein
VERMEEVLAIALTGQKVKNPLPVNEIKDKKKG